MVQYDSDCASTGACAEYRRYAFDQVDFRDLYTNYDAQTGDAFADQVMPGEIFCCQSGKNCEDGYNGCEPSCTSCCNTDVCDFNVYCSVRSVFYCNGSRCVNYDLFVPYLRVSGNNFLRVNWSNFDFATDGPITCQALKAARTLSATLAGDVCQKQTNLTDDDIPCMLQLYSVDSGNVFCPSCNVKNKKG